MPAWFLLCVYAADANFKSKVVLNPVFFRWTNHQFMLIDFFAFLMLADSQPFTVTIIGDLPSFLSSNNVFVVKLVKMWLGRIPDMVV